ncbi:MAG: hypothetical protein WC477_07305 [Patescibacteria group bacterium]
MDAQEHIRICEKLATIQTTVENVETKIDALDIRLEGYSRRLRKVENWKTSMVAIAAFLGSVITLAGRYVLDSVFRK